jgi:hypothetical protein
MRPAFNTADPQHTGKFDTSHVRQILRAAQWLMLIVLIAQVAAVVVALLVRWSWRGGSAACPAHAAPMRLLASPLAGTHGGAPHAQLVTPAQLVCADSPACPALRCVAVPPTPPRPAPPCARPADALFHIAGPRRGDHQL